MEEEAARPRKDDDPHWKRNALLPPLIFTGLGIGLILSGFLVLLYSAPIFGALRFYTGLVIISVGFLVLLFMVIGGGQSEVRRGMRRGRD